MSESGRDWCRMRGPLVRTTLLLLAIQGCGGDDSTVPTQPSASYPMTATIDGAPWRTANATAQTVPGAPGEFIIQGGRIIVQNPTSTKIELHLYNIAGAGAYPLGTGPTVFGGSATMSTSTSDWATAYTGSAGAVTITSLDAAHITGTFSFTARPILADSSSVVSNGQFDLPLNSGGTLDSLAGNQGGLVTCNLGGAPWNAADALVYPGLLPGSFSVDARTEAYIVDLKFGFLSPGTYTLSDTSTVVSLGVFQGTSTPVPGSNCCWWTDAGVTGSITIASVTSARVAGTFEATLPPQPGTVATAPLVITSGRFDLGLP